MGGEVEHRKPFAEAVQMRAGVQAHAQAAARQPGRQPQRGRALAGRAGHDDQRKRRLDAQRRQQRPHGFERLGQRRRGARANEGVERRIIRIVRRCSHACPRKISRHPRDFPLLRLRDDFSLC
jgi:hypothetical protein